MTTFSSEDLKCFKDTCKTEEDVINFLKEKHIEVSSEKAQMLLSNIKEGNLSPEEASADDCCTYDGECMAHNCSDFWNG